MKPIIKTTLADNLAQELLTFIEKQGYRAGQKLPSTTEIAKNFGVGLPTLREALKKLDAMGSINVRHGSGIYVGEHVNSLFLMNPMFSKGPSSKKQLLDLIDARIQFEGAAASLAAKNADKKQLEMMESILKEAENNLQNDDVLNQVNMGFHREISVASGNTVFTQIIGILSSIFNKEQLLLIGIFRSRKKDHQMHVKIFEAIKERNEKKAGSLMHEHLLEVRKSIQRWDFNNGNS